jgi:dTDP-4-amino-4,6-dideoxygalactose transaminase
MTSEPPVGDPVTRRGIVPANAPDAPVYVTRPELPPLREFLPYLEQIWDSRILSNNGPFHRELEEQLAERWQVPYVSLFASGTAALVTALQALRVTGEVVTTPFSFAATAHSVTWNRLEPVFADIDPDTLNLDPESVESALTAKTSAVLPVHTYGRPCDVTSFRELCDQQNLSLIYDAAHCFDVSFQGKSLLCHGDLAVLSFHATKVFNTFEGGAIVSSSKRLKSHIDNLKNFGFVNEATIVAPGINGKMSEFNAALGLAQLKRIDGDLADRAAVDARYREGLKDVPGIVCHAYDHDQVPNYGYFPIRITEEYPLTRDQTYELLAARGIRARRYFYPLLTDTVPYRSARRAPGGLPHAERIAQEVLCLPIFPGLDEIAQEKIMHVLVDP